MRAEGAFVCKRDRNREYYRKRLINGPEWAERRREYMRGKRATDPEYVALARAREREYYHAKYANDSEWAERKRERARASRRRRRAQRRHNGFEPYEDAAILARSCGKCVYCGEPATTIDHVVPLSRGGPDIESNVVGACLRCNLKKGAKTVEEFVRILHDGGITSVNQVEP